jgi:hypothetical protein
MIVKKDTKKERENERGERDRERGRLKMETVVLARICVDG